MYRAQEDQMAAVPQTRSEYGELLHRPSETGRAFWGPGDHYTFLVTGEETGGAYFVMQALVPPGGGPPPHIHTREDETFYLLEGQVEFLFGEETIVAGPEISSTCPAAPCTGS